MALARIKIRRLDDEVKTRHWVRASANGRSMEEEAQIVVRAGESYVDSYSW